MDGLILFFVCCMLLYLQASVYVFWHATFTGLYHWFSLSTLLFSVWMLAYVFAGMGEVAAILFPKSGVTLTGLLIMPAFLIRFYLSLSQVHLSTLVKNTLFFIMLGVGVMMVYLLIQGGAVESLESLQLFVDWRSLLPLHVMMLMLHLHFFLKLRLHDMHPNHVAHYILNHTDSMVIICDQYFRVLYVNDFAKKYFRQTHQHMRGNDFWMYVKDGGDIKKKLGEAFNQPEGSRFVCQMNVPVGQSDLMAMHVYRVTDVFKDIHAYAIVGDKDQDTDHLRLAFQNCGQAVANLENEVRRLTNYLDTLSDKLAITLHTHAEHVAHFRQTDELVLAGIQERELLISEIYDRVISNMYLMITVIRLHVSGDLSASLHGKLNSLTQRIRAMLLVHEHLYFSLHYSDVDVKAFFHKLIGELSARYDPETRIEVSLRLTEKFLDIGRAIPLGIILNELVTNCYLYAFVHAGGADSTVQPVMSVSFHESVDVYTLSVEDNGRGEEYWPEDMSEPDTGGLALVAMLVRDELNGHMHLATSDGTRVKIDFPVRTDPDHDLST